jgi:hypothetical protein
MYFPDTKLTEMSLGREGIAYIDSCLRGETGLCAKIAETSFHNGATFAPLPDGTSLDRAWKFNTGGLLSRQQANAWLADYVQSSRVGADGGCLVFQDVWARSSDPGIALPDAFFQGTNVYYCLEKNAVDLSSVSRIFRQIRSFFQIAMYCEYPPDENVSNSRFVDETVIADLARKTVRIFAGAYDQEGFVVWSKRV